MVEPSGFRVRLRTRIAKGLTTDATTLTATIANNEVTIRSEKKDEPLKLAKWVILSARGFATETEAEYYGKNLRATLQLAAFSTRLGADVGTDKPTAWISEDFARACGWIEPHERIAPNVHGLLILPDDERTRIPLVNIAAAVTSDPDQFICALNDLGKAEVQLGRVERPLNILNLALMTTEPLAQMVLAFSAIEELGQKKRSGVRRNLRSKRRSQK